MNDFKTLVDTLQQTVTDGSGNESFKSFLTVAKDWGKTIPVFTKLADELFQQTKYLVDNHVINLDDSCGDVLMKVKIFINIKGMK